MVNHAPLLGVCHVFDLILLISRDLVALYGVRNNQHVEERGISPHTSVALLLVQPAEACLVVGQVFEDCVRT
jgi:hypothetical protein